jgi:LCP family protein required for cell wall assembly
MAEEKKKNKKGLFIGLGALALFGVIAGASLALRKPMGQPLELAPTATLASTATVAPTETKPAPTDAPTSTPTIAPSPTPDGICGNTGSMVLLFAGSGTAGGMNSADAVRVLKIDFNTPELTVIAFPRDLWVQTPGLAALKINESLLGPSFDAKRKSVEGSNKAKDTAAVNLLAQVLLDNFGVISEHYITVNVEPWGKMIDTIGGVEVDLPTEVKLNNGITLPAGKQVLNGTLAKDYVRSLFEASDAIRIDRQDIFVKALHDKVMSTKTLLKIPQLLKDFNTSIATDLSPAQILSLGCVSEQIKPAQIKYVEISGDLVTVREDGALLPKTGDIKKKLDVILKK